MRKFICKLFTLSIPLILLILITNILTKKYGEAFVDFNFVIEKDDFKLIGQKYSESNTIWIKSKLAEKRKAKIIALGSSRVLQFRKGMFSESFFNYGYTTSQNYTILPTLKLIPDNSLPELLIVGLDQWNFNTQWDNSTYPFRYSLSPRLKNYLSPREYLSFYKDIFKNGYQANIPDGIIGMNALYRRNGFRRDGSRNYGAIIKQILAKDSTIYDYKFINTLDRIKEGNARFQWGEEINYSQLNYIEDLISFCETKRIKLLLFLPPFAPKVWNKMVASGKYNYINNLSEELTRISEVHDVLFFDFTTQGEISFTDDEMLDGFHGSEIVYSKILLRVAEEDTVFKNYIHVKSIRNALERTNELNIFDYPVKIIEDEL